MNATNELTKFKKYFLLHSSRYNLYANETLIKGSTQTHNQAVKALGKLQDKVISDPLLYSDLLLELLQDGDPKVSLCAGFTCLKANLHIDKAVDTLISISKNTSGISLICDFDIRGSITSFNKQQIENKPHNEVDVIAEKMKAVDITDEELLDMIIKLQDIDMCGHDGRTLLIHACVSGRVALIGKIVKHGADVNKTDGSQKSPLHYAVILGNIEVINILIEHQSIVNAKDVRGFTALDYAKGNFSSLPDDKSNAVAELLISHGGKTKQELLVK